MKNSKVGAPSASQGPKTSKRVLHIGGVAVEFPYQPYGTQLAFMNRVITTLDRAHREGRSHALLESPTGTGKSLSLLCSTLAWQHNFKSKILYANFTPSNPHPQALDDPIAHGGGFIPDTQPSGNPNAPPSAPTNGKKKKAPTIFYATRTHSQVSQVIREYRKTSYRVPMAVLASRKHLCTNMYLRGEDNIDEKCKLLLKDREGGCSEFKNAHKVKGHPSLQKGGCHEAHDIEDIVKVGQTVKGCSYFAARSMADDAELVFCPYSYIVSPVIRRAMEVVITGAIIIFDEAHNIEDICRDAGSVDVEDDTLVQLQMELEQLTLTDAMTYQPLIEMIQDLLSWIDRKKDTLERHDFQHYFSGWTGDKALKELQEANITKQCFPILRECASKALKAASEAEPETPHLSGMAATVLEGLISSLNYFFLGNGLHVCDYQLALQRYVRKGTGPANGRWTHAFSLWCLNPAVVFREIADSCLSVILTSGTLSPMDSFSSELGVTFGTSLEAPHVIDVDSQLWAAVISRGPPRNYPLNASFKTANSYDFQDALGTSLEEICKIVPGGCLVFFPSYSLMEKLSSRWKETGQWARLNARKPLFVEPRGCQEEFELVLKGYYSSINKRRELVVGRKKKFKKPALSGTNPHDFPEDNKKEGAALLAVCRGKVSEGIDFSDEKARVVIVVGIPFPNINDIQVSLKKKFNNTFKSSKNLLSGSEWYCNQAFRALNQATGRCIRHRFDYGAVIFLDERFCEARNRAYVSKWLRNSIRHFSSFDKSMEELKSFFKDVKERVGKTSISLQSSDIDVEEIGSVTKRERSTQKNQEPNISGLKEEQSGALKFARPCQSLLFNNTSSAKRRVDAPHVLLSDDEDSDGCRRHVDLECDPELTIVEETPATDKVVHVSSPQSFSKDENSSSTIIQASGDHMANHLPNTELGCELITPEKYVCSKANKVPFGAESSVNSHVEKRIKRLDLSSIVHLRAQELDTQIKDGNQIDSQFDKELEDSKLGRSPVLNNCDSSVVQSKLALNERLQIFCSLCKTPLGLPESNLFVMCLRTSSTKTHLKSHWNGQSEIPDPSRHSIPILIADNTTVEQRMFDTTRDSVSGQGIWCKEDGCVFKTMFCPFCVSSRHCLGVQVMAADESNIHLLNKVLLYCDGLMIKRPEASINESSPSSNQSSDRKVHSPIESFSFTHQQNLGGWRTTKSKMRLPKRR